MIKIVEWDGENGTVKIVFSNGTTVATTLSEVHDFVVRWLRILPTIGFYDPGRQKEKLDAEFKLVEEAMAPMKVIIGDLTRKFDQVA